jgi:hypothetical protein
MIKIRKQGKEKVILRIKEVQSFPLTQVQILKYQKTIFLKYKAKGEM